MPYYLGSFHTNYIIFLEMLSFLNIIFFKSASQWEGSACTHEGSSFISFGRGAAGSFQDVPENVPNSILVLSHMFYPKFNSHRYKLKQ